MKDIKEIKLTFCGLPESGKTSFLAALSHLSNSCEIATDLKLESLPKHRYFINNLADRWLGCEEVLRTQVSNRDRLEMTVSKGSQRFRLEMPDLSGETWKNLWVDHELDNENISFINQSHGILFFIHCDNIQYPYTIGDVQVMNYTTDSNGDEKAKPAPWNPSIHTPTQTIVVDLLSKLFSLIDNREARLAIVLSAWDKADEGIAPTAFIQRELPLLGQYLNSKLDFQYVEIFGVSAQGGDLKNNEIRTRLGFVA
ncbi:hypothetical protein [Enterovibrio nigricans]|uniref:Double-GTPase 1 domain-containing protein n=1 Tax=Enterovibrio nigricans DSM 22720 TaxID=1121868 RepID=A0A1T4VM47_9GAMM|nr:hypothetical protein [Enterovibrio nigricans]PKF49273.1 hypothetical protein AT251_20055 [Enterovibrio nigricans]SKA66042.1 hypothetical protein SAMN02745132_04055 [Enterovibrio nigricans DSM 22720]